MESYRKACFTSTRKQKLRKEIENEIMESTY